MYHGRGICIGHAYKSNGTACLSPSTRKFSQQVPSEASISLESFKTHYFNQAPLVLKNTYRDLPAIRTWHVEDHKHLRRHGSVIVPVEITQGASTYASRNSGTKFERAEVPLSLFLDLLSQAELAKKQGIPLGETGIYLAQHALFDSIPELYADVCDATFVESREKRLRVPEHATSGKGDIYNINAWIGLDTHTPLHHDPYHNIFVQLHGRKRVLMFEPNAIHGLAMHTDPLLKNTSTIQDVFESDGFDGLSPETRQASYEATLSPGDGLYIPRGWLHSFRGKSTVSSSVNWWFL